MNNKTAKEGKRLYTRNNVMGHSLQFVD